MTAFLALPLVSLVRVPVHEKVATAFLALLVEPDQNQEFAHDHSPKNICTTRKYFRQGDNSRLGGYYPLDGRTTASRIGRFGEAVLQRLWHGTRTFVLDLLRLIQSV